MDRGVTPCKHSRLIRRKREMTLRRGSSKKIRPLNVVLLCVLVVLGSYTAWRELFVKTTWIPRVEIAPEMRACKADNECALVSTMCACQCWGEAINEAYRGEIAEQLRQKCRYFLGHTCSKSFCPLSAPVCYKQACTVRTIGLSEDRE